MTVTGCPPTDGVVFGNGVVAFRRSGRGRRVSRAALSHAANHLYPTAQDAAKDPAHPGDNTKVVQLIIPRQLFNQLFGAGQRSADLRHML